MFRIRSDNRSFECESREEVERLLRNAVIRPDDLIFYEERGEWGPIGEHSSFAALCAELSERRGTGREGRSAGGAPAPESRDVVGGEEAGAGADRGEPEPPEPPEGAEPGRADSDEVTVMTEETLETYLEDPPRESRDVGVGAETEAEGGVPGAVDEESGARSGSMGDGGAESEYVISDEMSAGRDRRNLGRHDLPEEVFATSEIDQKELNVDSISTEAPTDDSSSEQEDPDRKVEDALRENFESLRREETNDDWDAILSRLRETDELGSEALGELSGAAESVEVGYDGGPSSERNSERAAGAEEYDSEAYGRAFPIEVGPTGRDIELGLKRSEVSARKKDRAFPYPGPKYRDEPVRRTYELRRPGRSLVWVALLAAGATMILWAVGLWWL